MIKASRIFTPFFALALLSCAPSEEEEGGGTTPPIGFELAVAGQAPVATSTGEARVINLSVEDVASALAAGNVRLIDIRREDEVANGMIPGAEHIAMEEFDPAAVTEGDDRPIILYCRSGRRSGIVGAQLSSHLGAPSKHLAGGINAWVETGEPIT